MQKSTSNLSETLIELSNELDGAFRKIRSLIIDAISTGISTEIYRHKIGEEDAFQFDMLAQTEIERAIWRIDNGIPIISEETERSGCESSRFLAVVDPIDGSGMVKRGFYLCSSAVSIVDSISHQPLLSKIIDIGTGSIVTAMDGVVSVDRNICTANISKIESIRDAFIVSYAAKGPRVRFIARNAEVLAEAKMYLNYGGPLDIARIALGQVDAMVEIDKGFKCYDFLAGAHILVSAGGTIISPDGQLINPIYDKIGRIKFIATGTKSLAIELLSRLSK